MFGSNLKKTMSNPYFVIDEFEKTLAEYAGSTYGVAVESCTAALFLSLEYRRHKKKIKHLGSIGIPAHTYPGVACSIIHAGGHVKFSDNEWKGIYELYPYNVIDGALRFQKGMYSTGLHCLSFHVKKHLPIGRGGMILTDDEEAYRWLKKARFDGRDEVPLQQDEFTMLGWNMYMTPEQAVRGLQLFSVIKNKVLPDLDVQSQQYPDLSKFRVYRE